MKNAIVAALAVASIIAGTTAPASAGPSGEVAQGYQGYQAYEVKTQYVQKRRYKKRRIQYQQQYWADKLPYGSQSLVAADGPRRPRRPPPVRSVQPCGSDTVAPSIDP